MKYRPFGQTGLDVSELVFGCGAVGGLMINASEEEREQAFSLAIEGGVNWFDTAAAYGQGQSETNLGALLQQCENRPYVSTKVTIDTRRSDYRDQVERSLTESLARLQLDKVTLLQLHNPIAAETDRRTLGADEVLKDDGVLAALEAVREKGLCEHIGITALGEPGSIIEVIKSHRLDSAQVYYNLLNPSAGRSLPHNWPLYDFGGVLDACDSAGVAAMNIRVFSAGVIATEKRHGREQPLTLGDTVDSEAEKARYLFKQLDMGDDTRAQTAIRFALAEKRLSCVVVGLAELSYLTEAIAAAESGPMSEQSLDALREAWGSFNLSSDPD